MDVDNKRKLALLSRDPRAYRGSTSRRPGDPDPNGATNIAGVYVIDAKDPADLKLLSFEQLPTGHTTSCVNDCEWLWTGGPAPSDQQEQAGWLGGRPIIVTDLRDPSNPVGYPQKPVDLFRQDGVTAYAHDVDVDDAGIAWVAGLGGTRGYYTEGRALGPGAAQGAPGHAAGPGPVRGRRPLAADHEREVQPRRLAALTAARRQRGRLDAQLVAADRPDAPRDWRYLKGELLLGTEEWFGAGANAAATRASSPSRR